MLYYYIIYILLLVKFINFIIEFINFIIKLIYYVFKWSRVKSIYKWKIITYYLYYWINANLWNPEISINLRFKDWESHWCKVFFLIQLFNSFNYSNNLKIKLVTIENIIIIKNLNYSIVENVQIIKKLKFYRWKCYNFRILEF